MFKASPQADIDPPTDRDGQAGRTSESPIGLDRLWKYTWWSSVGVICAAGVWVVIFILDTHPVGPAMVVGLAGAAVVSLASALLMDRRLRQSSPSDESAHVPVSSSPIVLIAIAGTVIVLVAGQAASGDRLWSIIPGLAIGAIAVTVPRMRRMTTIIVGVVASAAIAGLASYGLDRELDPAATGESAMVVTVVTLALVSGPWAWDIVTRLDRSRRVETDLAVANERLRFASELHDVQGHQLQVIALESELATRLVDEHPRTARDHMQRVNTHARQALTDTRSVVHGYRRVSLGNELANATGVLAAAGIDGRLTPGTEAASAVIAETGRHLLGLVVREATTNILRHSDATRARLALSADGATAHLDIRNDGASRDAPSAANGLASLADRIGHARGHLEWRQEGEWFILTARLPLEKDGDT